MEFTSVQAESTVRVQFMSCDSLHEITKFTSNDSDGRFSFPYEKDVYQEAGDVEGGNESGNPYLGTYTLTVTRIQ